MIEKETNSKLVLRSEYLKKINTLKDFNPKTDEDLKLILQSFLNIEDKYLLADIILKEIRGNNTLYDNLLRTVLVECIGRACEKPLVKALKSKSVNDKKKLLLLNILMELDISPNLRKASLYIKDTDSLMQTQMKNLLQLAKVSPQTQIDFLDFFLNTNECEQKDILKSIVDKHKKDDFINLLALIFYYDENIAIKLNLQDKIKNSKSYFAFEIFDTILKYSKNIKLINEAKKWKLKNKYTKKSLEKMRLDLFKEILQNSKPKEVLINSLDGLGNFVLVFSREYKNKNLQTFISVLNINKGPVAAFGFEEISKEEYKVIISKIFKDNEYAKIPPKEGVKIIQELTKKANEKKLQIPYEFLSWVRTSYDIKETKENIFKPQNTDIKFDNLKFQKLLNTDFMKLWFIKEGDSETFDNLLSDLTSKKFSKKIFELAIFNIFKYIDFEQMLIFQAYVLKKQNKIQESDLLFAIIKNEVLYKKLQNEIAKNSLVKYCLSKNLSPDTFLRVL